MISLEQVKLLESKVTRAIDYIKRVTEENTRLKGKLDANQKRIDELEVLIQQFKDEQSRIEDGILSALDRLNQFEDAVESLLSSENNVSVAAPGKAVPKKTSPKEKEASGPTEKPEPPLELKEESNTGGELDIF